MAYIATHILQSCELVSFPHSRSAHSSAAVLVAAFVAGPLRSHIHRGILLEKTVGFQHKPNICNGRITGRSSGRVFSSGRSCLIH
jgi:hypothetical protein